MTHQNGSLLTDFNCCSSSERLPLEIISHIVSHLSHQDVKSARLVCFKWYLASLVPRLIDKERFVLVCRGNKRVLRVMPINCVSLIRESKREFFHLEVMGSQAAKWFDVEFFREVGHRLKSLLVEPFVPKKRHLLESLQYFSNLKHLSIRIEKIFLSVEDASHLSLSSFPDLTKLESLELTTLTDFNLGLIPLMLSKSPKLKSIYIKEISMKNLSADDLMTCLKIFPERMFDVVGRIMNDDSIFITVTRPLYERSDPNVRLCALSLRGCPEWLPSWNPECLKELDLLSGLSDNQFAAICETFPNLEKLCLAHLRDVTEGAERLASLKKLTSLSLRAVFRFDDATLLEGLCSEMNTTLKEVFFHFMKTATSRFFIEFARTHPALTSLTVVNCEGVNNASVQAFFKYMTSLQVFGIPGCIVTDVGLNGTVMEVPWNTDNFENPTGHSLSRLTDLRQLELRAVKFRGTVFEMGAKFNGLEMLGMSFSLVDLTTLELILENHPGLRKLDLSKLPITDQFLEVIIEKLPQLEVITLNECVDVTANGRGLLSERGIFLSHSYQWDLI